MRFRAPSDLPDRGRKTTAKLLQRALTQHVISSHALAKRRMLVEQLCDRRVLADIAGMVFEDANASWRYEAGESTLGSRVVFLDSNDNGEIDEGETVQLTDAAGRFDFEVISGDETIVRLFNGSPSDTLPIFPIAPTPDDPGVLFSGGTSIASLVDGQLIALAGNAAIRADLATGTAESVMVPGLIRSAQPLPNGRILVLASDDAGNEAFTIDAAGSVTPLVLQASDPTAVWSDVAIDASGNGVLVEQSDEDTLLRAIAVGDSIAVGSSTLTVGEGTRVISGGELTTVISTPTDDGLRLRLWSNATGTEIGSGGVEIAGGLEVLSYNDASGLVLVRNAADSVSLFDAAAGFASLQTLSVNGLVTFDHNRELLFAISPVESVLRVIDLNTATLIGQFSLDAESIVDPSQVTFDASTGKLLVLTAGGIAPLALLRADSHRIKVSDGGAGHEWLFAVEPSLMGENTPPRFEELPLLSTLEDTSLVVAAPQLLATAVDEQDDRFIVLLDTQAENGTVVITPTGGLGYIPNQDFFGVDRFKVNLHDGQSSSDPIELSINVTPVNDELDFTFEPNIIPENVAADFVVGLLDVINVDGGEIIWGLSDPRFQVIGNQMVVTPGSVFNFSDEPFVDVSVTASESTSSESITKSVRLTIGDVQELEINIQPDTAIIDENRVGELIAEIFVLNDGEDEQYAFTVDDDRFEIDFRDLRLKPGVSLDFESEPTVTVNITATASSGLSKTEPIIITVRDIAEQASNIELSREQVIELVRGAVVGDVIVDGNVLASGYIATVDDSRFEIVDSKLKLRDSEFVRRSEQEEIQLVITVQDSASSFLPIVGTFVIEVLANSNPFHNEDNPYDVNGDGQVNPLDALMILNSMARNGGPGPISGYPSPDRFYDVNGDGLITPLDALLIINYLNRLRRTEGEQNPLPNIANGEPESVGPVIQSPPSQLKTSPVGSVEPTEIANLPAAKSKDASLDFATIDLVKLRDDVLELLVTDNLSKSDEVEAAIDDFFID